jgi:hypothetical protein
MITLFYKGHRCIDKRVLQSKKIEMEKKSNWTGTVELVYSLLLHLRKVDGGAMVAGSEDKKTTSHGALWKRKKKRNGG